MGVEEKPVVMWIASGKRYIQEARTSALSVIRQMPDVERVLCTPDAVNEGVAFTSIIDLPARIHHHWFLDSLNYLNMVVDLDEFSDRKILWLDTDTYVIDPVYELFTSMLGRYDLLGTHAPARHTTQTVTNPPDSFPELNIGVIAFLNNSKMRLFWKYALGLYYDHEDCYKNNDQGPLRDALWTYHGISLYILPPEYDVRFNFDGFVGRSAKILHGRSDDYASVADKLRNVVMKSWKSGAL